MYYITIVRPNRSVIREVDGTEVELYRRSGDWHRFRVVVDEGKALRSFIVDDLETARKLAGLLNTCLCAGGAEVIEHI